MKYQSDDKIGQLKLSIALNIPNLPPIPCNDYRLIVIDPPWQYNLRESDATHRGRCPYPAMSDEQILSLPIGAIAHQNSYVMLWVTNNHLPLGFRCLERWGFEYKSIFIWEKTTKDGSKPHAGLGHYGRNCTEQFLVGTKGNPDDEFESMLVATRGKPGSFSSHGLTNVNNIIKAPRSRHSEKPKQFWAIADRLGNELGGAKIELFARSKRAGWDSWGLEVE